MKKLLTIAAIAGVASLSHGQGYIGVATTTTTKVSANGFPTAAYTNGGHYYLDVLIAPTSVTTINLADPLSGGWQDTTIMLTNFTAGRFVGANDNYDFYNGSGAQIAPSLMSYPPGSTADCAVVGWSANLGPTLADALAAWNGGGWLYGDVGYDPGLQPGTFNGYIGISSVALDGYVAPAGGPYWSIWGTAANGAIPGMNLWPDYPEPSTFALCALGAAMMLFLRRRT